MSLFGEWLVVAAAIISSAEPLAVKLEFTTDSLSATDRRVCVAARVAPGSWLTTSHCVADSPPLVRAKCNGVEIRIQSVFRHPTHDLAIIRAAAPPRRCRSTILKIAPPDAVGGRFEAPLVPGVGTIEVGKIGVDNHILRLVPEAGCWTNGDSGTPILGKDGIVAILQGGAPGCKGAQTAVRVDRLKAWITTHVQD